MRRDRRAASSGSARAAGARMPLRGRDAHRPRCRPNCRRCSPPCARASPAGPSARRACPRRRSTRSRRRSQAARFGVAVWSAATLDALTIEMLCGLVEDLNAGTRASPACRSRRRQCGRRAAGLRLDDRISDAHRLRPRLSRARSVALRCARAWSRAARPIAPCGSRPTARRRPPGAARSPTIALTRRRRRIARRAARADRGRPARRSITTASSTTRRAGHAGRGRRRRSRATPISVADAIARIAAALPSARSAAMLTRIAGGRVIDPANRPRRHRRRLDARRPHRRRAGRRDARRRDPRRHRQDRHGRRDRHPFAYRRRQREHGAAAAAGASPRSAPRAGRHAAVECRLVDLRDRLPLRRTWASPPWSSRRCRRITRCRRISSSPTSRSSTRRPRGARQ